MHPRTAVALFCTVLLLLVAAGGVTGAVVEVSDRVDTGEAGLQDESLAQSDAVVAGGTTTVASTGTTVGTGTPVHDGVAGTGVDPGVTTGSSGSDDVAISETLERAEGTVEALVRFEGTTATSPDELRAHADAVRQPFESFAGATPGVTVESRLWLTPAVLVTVDTDRVGVDRLADIEGVEAVVENARVTVQTGGASSGGARGVDSGGPDPAASTAAAQAASPGVGEQTVAESGVAPTASYDTTYGLAQINATTVWDAYGTQGEGTSVAVLDTGADDDHPDIDVAKWAEFDSNGNQVDTTPNDGDGHGTHVSGTVSGGNASGTHIGVAPATDLYAVKVLADDGSGTFAQIIAGMQWAVDQNADIMSMSLGAQGYYDQFIDPVRNAQAAGTTVVASSGNSGEGTSGSPGNVYDAISVGASNQSAGIADFSSGEVVDTASDWGSSAPSDWPSEYIVPSVSAPGSAVNSSVPGGGYGNKWGTSMAAPHVSGAAALVESAVSYDVSPAAFEAAFEATAFKPPDAPAPPGERDTRYGSGIIDVPAAIDYLSRPDYQLSNLTPATETVTTGNETIDVSVDVTNAGAEMGQQNISLAVTDDETGGEAYAETASGVDVAAGETRTITFETVPAGDLAPGNYTHEVSSANDSAAGSLAVLAPASFAVAIVGADDAVEGENLTVTASVENTGDVDGTETVTLAAGALGDAETNVTLAGGTATEVALNVSTSEGDAGEYTATVTSATDSDNTTVVVDAPAESVLSALDIAGAGANATLTEGEDANVSVAVENVGDRAGSFDVTLAVGSAVSRTATTSELAGGAAETVTFENVTGALADGTYAVTASTADDAVSGEMTVEMLVGLRFSDQNASEQHEAVVESVSSEGESVLLVTYENDDGGDIVAGVANGTFGGENVTVVLEEYVGFPAQYTAHLVAEANASGSYGPGDTLSANTTEAVLVDATARVTTPIGAPDVEIIDGSSAMDTTGDGLLNDVRGDGGFDIFDVQTLFNNLDSDTVQNNSEHFNFQVADPDEVNIFDVQTLFGQLG